jgi:hypothetical protein
VLAEAGRSREARTDELGVAVSDGEWGTCGDWGRGVDIVAMAESLCRRMRKFLGLLCWVGGRRVAKLGILYEYCSKADFPI